MRKRFFVGKGGTRKLSFTLLLFFSGMFIKNTMENIFITELQLVIQHFVYFIEQQ